MRALVPGCVLALALLASSTPLPARAQGVGPVSSGGPEIHEFDDPADEARFRRLTWELRCLVCQNQNIAESNADLAKDLRRKVDEMIRAGRTDEEIIDYMVDRYGDFVLYRPRFDLRNALLWLGPAILVLGGLTVLWRYSRRLRAAGGGELTTEEAVALSRLVEGAPGPGGTGTAGGGREGASGTDAGTGPGTDPGTDAGTPPPGGASGGKAR